MKIDVDFRLLDVSLELHALEDHYELIEKQIMHLSHVENETLDEYRNKENLTPGEVEYESHYKPKKDTQEGDDETQGE